MQWIQTACVIPVKKVTPVALQLLERVEGGYQTRGEGQDFKIAKVVRPQGGKQRQTNVGRRGAMGDDT